MFSVHVIVVTYVRTRVQCQRMPAGVGRGAARDLVVEHVRDPAHDAARVEARRAHADVELRLRWRPALAPPLPALLQNKFSTPK